MDSNLSKLNHYKVGPIPIALSIAVGLLLTLYTIKLHRDISLMLINREVELEAMHSQAYDQGYVSAIWDTYLDKPLYRIVEEPESGEPSLWRKTDVDPVNKKKLDELDPKPESSHAETQE